ERDSVAAPAREGGQEGGAAVEAAPLAHHVKALNDAWGGRPFMGRVGAADDRGEQQDCRCGETDADGGADDPRPMQEPQRLCSFPHARNASGAPVPTRREARQSPSGDALGPYPAVTAPNRPWRVLPAVLLYPAVT